MERWIQYFALCVIAGLLVAITFMGVWIVNLEERAATYDSLQTTRVIDLGVELGSRLSELEVENHLWKEGREERIAQWNKRMRLDLAQRKKTEDTIEYLQRYTIDLNERILVLEKRQPKTKSSIFQQQFESIPPSAWLALLGILSSVIVFMYKEKQAKEMTAENKALQEARVRDLKDTVGDVTVMMGHMESAINLNNARLSDLTNAIQNK